MDKDADSVEAAIVTNRAQLSRDGAPERASGKRYCGCPCGQSIDHLAANAKYINAAHGQRAYRLRVRAEMERVNLPPLPSFRAARLSRRPTTTPNGEGERERKRVQTSKRSGAQVSYRRAIVVLHLKLGIAPSTLERALRHALPAAQRARIESRDRSLG